MLVNRAWHWHFGKGLVTTPSDFGSRSDPPTHPELLDYLARSSSPRAGRSSRSIARSCSRAPISSGATPGPTELERDPENRLLWRFNRQRLDFESMRDAVLAASGALDPTIGGRPTPITEAPFSARRTLYGFIDRQNLDGLYRTFDFAVPDATSPRRFVTTVPQQALFLMNSPFLHEQSRHLAALAQGGGFRTISPTACAGSTFALWAARPSRTSWRWGSSSSAGRQPPVSPMPVRGKCHRPRTVPSILSAWEQLARSCC